ncbi:tetratricopeptide repeat protein [Parerythrobacter jejuensis]|uniref:DUF1570 domain-containing protein n=1 Tax=Parerythrobacter jejuensis TaxID=795812 RepID=A0A845ATL9_9SPHN|nr:hypothetical protein [Parerythrobacter jejuensis]MXP32849.1 hypothetical protein [Parerythrobacter jejuensis]
MNLVSRFFAFVAAILCVSAPASAETWLRADTDNFILYSTGGEENLREWALKFERFDTLMRKRYRIPMDPSPNRLTIYLLDDSQAVMQSLAGRNRGGVAGYYSSQLDGSYAVTQRTIARKGDLSGQEVMFHEYGHHFMFRYFPFAYPGWYREGFAEYYATAEFDEEGNWTYGKPPLYRGATLTGTRRQISAKKMLTTAQKDLTDFESYQVYTRGWLLVHMMHSDPAKNRQLNDFLLRVGRGEDRKSAAEAAFGDLNQVERDMKRYMGKSPTYIRGRQPITYEGRLDIVTLDDIDSKFEALRLANRRNAKREQTRDALEKLAEQAPERVYILNELADAQHMIAHSEAWKAAKKAAGRKVKDEDIEAGAADMGWALATIEKALAIDPDNGRANALKAEFLMDMARDEEKDEYWPTARQHAIKANRANPDDPFPLWLYYKSFVEAGDTVDPGARAALVRAFELAPESDDLRVDYALDLALQGDFGLAQEVVEFLVASPHSEKRGKLAIKQIEALEAGASYLEVSDMKLKEEDEEGETA